MSPVRFPVFAAALLLAGAALAQSPAATSPPRTAPPPAPAATTAIPPATAPAGKVELLDINSASKEQLDALPGIGSARANAIIKGRPYRGKDELLRKKVLPSNVYDGIKDRVVARHS